MAVSANRLELLQIADAVALLASGRLAYMTGHPLVIDGGMSAL